MALGHIQFMGVLMNFTVRPLGLKVGGGEAREVNVRSMSAILTR